MNKVPPPARVSDQTVGEKEIQVGDFVTTLDFHRKTLGKSSILGCTCYRRGSLAIGGTTNEANLLGVSVSRSYNGTIG